MSRIWPAGAGRAPRRGWMRKCKRRWIDFWLSVQRDVHAKQAWRGPDENPNQAGPEWEGTK